MKTNKIWKSILIISILINITGCGDNESKQKFGVCTTEKDAIALSYKEEDLNDKFITLREKWHKKYLQAHNASLQNSKLTKMLQLKEKAIDEQAHRFSETFKKTVKIHISDTKDYSLACKNYAQLETKYIKILLQLQKEYDSFDNNNTKSTTTNNSNIYDGLSTKKYNHLVNIINTFTPKIRSSFKTYANECGTNKTKRTRPKVDAAMRMGANPKERAMYDKQFGYHIIVYYDGSYRDNAIKDLDSALAIDRLKYADTAIKEYKESILKFMTLFTEAFEYYDMQDYTEDQFKKADTMHTPLILAYEKVIKGDQELRKIIGKIEEMQILSRIKQYKQNNQMLFYYTLKSFYLSKKFLMQANKDKYTQLNPAEFKILTKELRDHYSEFNTFKQKNETLFKDNTQYTHYLQEYREYVVTSKKFYIRVKEKKPYDFGEKMLLQNSSRAYIEGSIYQLFAKYNKLVNELNSLNM